ncbi:MAG: alpha/beta fold hydrolase [Ilumatobacteraceae bacterium]
MTQSGYDEFGLFHENISEFGLDVDPKPVVVRVTTQLADRREISALKWGSGDPRLVLVHGGGQNAHTWDTVALALGVELLAVDLPGHGHSAWSETGEYPLEAMADEVAAVVEQHAPNASLLVGMSLGGLTSLVLSSRHSHLVRSLMMVDVTPGVTPTKVKAITDFLNGPQTFPSFDELLRRTIEHNPTRSETSLRRGILHNAKQLDDGTWQWKYDRRRAHGSREQVVTNDLWSLVERSSCPLALVRGALSPVVDDEDVAELLRRRPSATVHVVEGAGHSVQGDRPLELTELLRALL